MKVEEKMKKNINCELSHMIRLAGSLEVYKQKQNILFISESVEHRMFKVTLGKTMGVLRRVRVSSVSMAEFSGVSTVECACRAYARPSVHVGRTARQSVTTAWMGARRGGL